MTRIVYAGTPETAVEPLRRLLADGHHVVGVLTRKDAPLGRKRVLAPSPVAAFAEEQGLPVIRADRIDDATHHALEALEPDLGVVVAYGAIIPRRTLETPEHGWVNLHFSLLPDLRGAAPVQHALIRCHQITGVTVFVLDEGMDEGPVLGVMTETVRSEDTAGDLLERLALEGAGLLSQAIKGYVTGQVIPQAQTGEPTFAPKLHREDGRVDWHTSSEAVRGRIAGVTPEPGAFTSLKSSGTTPGGNLKLERVLVVSASDLSPEYANLQPGEIRFQRRKPARVLVGTGSSAVQLTRVQPAGKKMMDAADWARGGLPSGEGAFA